MTTNNALEAFNEMLDILTPNQMGICQFHIEKIKAALLDAPETVEGATREADNAFEAIKTILENGLSNETQKHNGLKYLNELRSYAQSRQSAGVPDGWKMVPIEPTEEMCLANHETVDSGPMLKAYKEQAAAEYKAMLEAAPQPPASAVDVEGAVADLKNALTIDDKDHFEKGIRSALYKIENGLIGQPVGGEDFQLEPMAQAIQNWGVNNGHTFIASEAEGLADTIRSILKHHAGE